MCQETVTIAICAPQNPPARSATCGKLHLIAAQRDVCDEARGLCVCFFGTCGNIVKHVDTDAVDLANLAKLRCATCTSHEDKVGDRRTGKDVIESLHLKKAAVDLDDETAVREYYDALQDNWGGHAACPYHEKTNLIPTAELTSEVTPQTRAPPSDHEQSVDDTTSPEYPTTLPSSTGHESSTSSMEHGQAIVSMGPSSSSDAENDPESDADIKENASVFDTDDKMAPPSLKSSPSSSRFVASPRDMSEVMENPRTQDAVRKIVLAKAFLAGKSLT